MSTEFQTIVIHLVAAIIAGGSIGIERSHHARPAGFRTHALVCLATSGLMMAAMSLALSDSGGATRVVQGIVTGIGFLGAGVIFKEGLNVRGLTTAASIWITAAIGILIGCSFFLAAAMTTVLTLIVLTLFRWIEAKVPVMSYAELSIGFARDAVMPEEDLRALLQSHGFSVADFSYGTNNDGTLFEYRLVIRTIRRSNLSRLAVSLRNMPEARSFGISPSGTDAAN